MTTERRNGSPWLHLLILLGCGVLVYANSLGNDFNIDDKILLLSNPVVHGLSPDNLVRIFTTVANGLEYLPIRDLTYALDYQFWGTAPFGYHLANLLYFLLTCCVFYLLLRKLLPLLGEAAAVVPLLAALLFVAHPVHVESVAGIAQRKDLVSGLLFLLSLYGYLVFRERGRWRFLAGALVCYLLALLAKATVICLPLLLPVLEYVCRQPLPAASDSPAAAAGVEPAAPGAAVGPERFVPLGLPAIAAILAVFVLVSGVYYQLQTVILTKARILAAGAGAADLFSTVNTALHAVLFYLMKLTMPYPLNFIHPFVASASPVELPGLLGLLVVVLFIGGLWSCRRRSRAVVLAGSWLLVCLLPVIGLLKTRAPYVVAERYLFLASMGYCLLVVQAGWLLARRSRRWQQLLTGLFCVALVGFGGVAAARNLAWKNAITLLEANIRSFPATPDPRLDPLRVFLAMNVGIEYYRFQQDAAAAQSFAYVAALNPSLAIYGQLFEALRSYERQDYPRLMQQLDDITAADKQNIYEINLLYGNLYAALGDAGRSRDWYRKAQQSRRALGFASIDQAYVAELIDRLH